MIFSNWEVTGRAAGFIPADRPSLELPRELLPQAFEQRPLAADLKVAGSHHPPAIHHDGEGGAGALPDMLSLIIVIFEIVIWIPTEQQNGLAQRHARLNALAV